MRRILFYMFIVIISTACLNCLSDGNMPKFVDNGEIIIISEEIINEFKDDEKAAVEKYKYRRFQLDSEIFLITSPARGSTSLFGADRVTVPVSLMFIESDCFFDFEFNSYVNDQYALKRGVKVIIQGYFINFSKLTNDLGGKYSEEIECPCFTFSRSEIIGIMDDEAEATIKKADTEQEENL